MAFKKDIKIAIPTKNNLKFFGNTNYENAYDNFIVSISDKNYNVEEIDFSPIFKVAELLYGGAWLSERFHAVGDFIEENTAEVDETVAKIILGGKTPSAVSYFDAEYKLKAFKKLFDNFANTYDAFIMPTAGTIYRKVEVKNKPIELNTKLGYYTNFMNLLDCSAIVLPVFITTNNLPFGITLFAPAFNDKLLVTVAKSMQKRELLNLPSSVTDYTDYTDYTDLAVCGAHKIGGTLNYQLLEIKAIYKSTILTTPEYRFFALDNLNPIRPGLIKDSKNGAQIEVQVWKVPSDKLGKFINQIGAPLTFGKITLENGKSVTSFLYESYALEGAKEITELQTGEKYLDFKESK